MDNRYTPGKIELAAFLAQVGLIGKQCADVLSDLADVDALAALTEGQYERYKIGEGKRKEIGMMLEARRIRMERENLVAKRQGQAQPTASTVVRPPPGFGRAAGAETVTMKQQPTFLSASAPGLNNSLTSQPTNLLPTVSDNEGGSALSGGRLPTNQVPAPQLAPPPSSACTFPIVSYGGNAEHTIHEGIEQDDESSRIEADLQELGGQMVGSILDF